MPDDLTRDEIYDILGDALKKDKMPEDVDIEHQGDKITLPETPEPMKLRSAVKVLTQKIKDEETKMDIREIIEAHPMDAIVAFNKAIKRKFGWTSATTQHIETFFGTREIRPDLVTVKTGPNRDDQVQVLSGQFVLPNVEEPIYTTPDMHRGQAVLLVYGEAKKRDWGIIREICNLTRDILREESIFKGKSIKLDINSKGKIDVNSMPSFLPTDNIDVGELILNDEELSQVEATLWAPITQTELCRQHGIPLNRGILLEGTFGTGKTMTAHVTSKVCVDNGWTYIVLEDVRALADALLFAQRYAPAVVFAEDVDRVASSRDQKGNDLLNTIDGVLTKNSEVITVLTTNFVEKLDVAMLRPGRLDAVISVKAPGQDAVKKLINQYARETMKDGETLDRVAPIVAGNIPATIREIVERAKLAMIYRGDSEIIEDDLIVSATNMKAHLELLAEQAPEPSLEERLGSVVKEVIDTTVSENNLTQKIEQRVQDIYDNM